MGEMPPSRGLLKIRWSPEHVQGPEQNLDISLTMSSLAHKTEDGPLVQQHPRYEWANDDISALTASNLLKKYAEKYSGFASPAYERPELGAYADAPLGPTSEAKTESDAWQMALREPGTFAANAMDNGLAGNKARSSSALPPVNGSVGMVAEACYPSNAGGTGPTPRIQSCLVPIGTSQECSPGYGATYLPSDYCSQATAAAVSSPLTSSLNGSSLLQPVHSMTTIGPSYNSTLAGVNSLYNYPSNHYHSQSSIGPGYSGVHLPSLGIPAPRHLPPASRPPIVPRYGYQSHSLSTGPLSPVPNGSKRKAFDVNPKEDVSRYGYGEPRVAADSYQTPGGACHGGGFAGSGDGFKGRKQHVVGDPAYKCRDRERKGAYNGGQLAHPPGSSEAFAPALLGGEATGGQGHVLGYRLQPQRVETVTASDHLEEQLRGLDSQLLSLVTNEIVDCSPPVQWGDIAGLEAAKALIEEQVLWPLLRPGAYNRAGTVPKSILLFGPSGGGKTMLTRCIATHLGATFLKVSGSSFVSKWKGDGEMILQAMFLIARSRQPSVIFINELDLMLSTPVGEESLHLNSIKAKLLSHVEGVVNSSSDHIIVIGGTRHPGDIEETIHRYFIKRLYISPPDGRARRQILLYTLAQQDHCLSEGEISLVVQNTEGYSGSDLMLLCREVALGRGDGAASHSKPATYKDFEDAFCKIPPSVSPKDLKLYTEWSKLFGSCV
ncbi:fidgetin-like [Leucoraja erinacea]|uniref:fidgetin-like n=1 Tax=Leucoraja erinaceus TaxID=7782 RepID=UPI00245532F3|nr:fidgetin-like [Leucoraja erinacea]